MSGEKKLYTEAEVSFLLSQASALSGELEAVLINARCAAAGGDQARASACMDRAYALMGRIGTLSSREGTRTGRPRAGIREEGDRTLGQIRNSLRLRVPAGTLAGELGISESTFRRRMRRACYLPNDVKFSQIP